MYSLSVVQETNLGSNLSAAGVVLLMQSVSVFGIGRFGSILSSEQLDVSVPLVVVSSAVSSQ